MGEISLPCLMVRRDSFEEEAFQFHIGPDIPDRCIPPGVPDLQRLVEFHASVACNCVLCGSGEFTG